MRVHKSVQKRARQNEKRRLRNSMVASRVRKAVREVREEPDGAKAGAAFLKASSLMDRAVRKGILHSNTAGRTKSRLAKLVSARAKSAP